MPEMTSGKRVFRILSLNGGGIRGLIPCVFLEKLEAILGNGKPLAESFDLIAGTSTGAILAAGLAVGMSPAQLRAIYTSFGRDIFPYRGRFNLDRLSLILKDGLSAPKFSADPLKGILKDQKGFDQPLTTFEKTKLLIPFYDTVGRQTNFFKTYDPTNSGGNYALTAPCQDDPDFRNVPLWEAVLCSASAPTYFPAHRLVVPVNGKDKTLSAIDGGVAANNPVACAVADAVRMGFKPFEIFVLSLGTGRHTRSISYAQAREWGAVEWAVPLYDVILDASIDVYRYITREVLPADNYIQLDFELTEASDDMDDATSENLKDLQLSATKYLDVSGSKDLQKFINVSGLS